MKDNQEKNICWICGDKADSGKHSIKKSDLNLIFKNISQKQPIYVRKNGHSLKHKTIGTTKSSKFYFETKICKKCNNERSQQFDEAWEKLSNYLSENWGNISNNGYINLNEIFGTRVKISMILVQLFFLKIFMCKCIDGKIDFNLNEFSEAILEKKEQSNFYISFRDSENNFSANYCASSDIEMLSDNTTGNIIYMHQFYTINEVTVDMIYALNENIVNLNGALKPSEMSEILPLSKLNYNQNYIPI